MGYDLEWLPVGNGEKSGDAIVMRWLDGSIYKIGVIDGGTKESGQSIVDHINKFYGPNSVIEFVLNTHPDCDHCSGLTVILEKMSVRALWMHLPWNYSSDLLQLIDDDRITDLSIERRLKEKLATAREIELLAKKKGVPIYEPFQGLIVGPFTILSPSKEWYKELVSTFRSMPHVKKKSPGLLEKAAEVMRAIAESIDIETLREDGETSSENESSVILFSELHGAKVLLTGDAGIKALTRAADYADNVLPGWNINLSIVQIPHHGSRRNVSPTILNRILGEKILNAEVIRGNAYVSASKTSTQHPRKAVLNAFKRRGYTCFRTDGQTIRTRKNTPDRDGWVSLKALPFYDEVESYE